jgi:hypothetical protein
MSATVIEGYRQDVTLLDASSPGDPRLITKVGAISLKRKGATVTSATGSPTGGGLVNVAVSDVGTLVPGDTVKVNAAGSTGVVQSASYTQTNLPILWAGAASWAQGDRITCETAASAPTAYSDPHLTLVITQPIPTGATTGRATFYTRAQDIDYTVVVDAVTSLQVDQAGIGGRETVKLGDWDGRGDNSFDNIGALQNAVAVVAASAGGVIEIPAGTWLLSAGLALANLAGVVIRGAGKGLTKLRFTNATSQITLTNCLDVKFQDIEIGRTVDGSLPLMIINSTCFRTVLDQIHWTRGSYAWQDQGIDTRVIQPTFDGSGWANGALLLNAKRPYIEHPVARIANSLSSGVGFIIVDGACESVRIVDPDIAPADLTLTTGTALVVSNTQAGAAGAKDTLVQYGRLVGGDKAGFARPAVILNKQTGGGGATNPSLVRFSGTLFEDSQNAARLLGCDVVEFNGCSVVGMYEDGVFVDTVALLRVFNHESSDVGQDASGTRSHIKTGSTGAVSQVFIAGLTYGNHVRGGAITAESAVYLDPTIGRPYTVLGVTGDSATLSGDVVHDGPALANDRVGAYVSHVQQTLSVASAHEAVAWASRTYTAAANPSVQNVRNVILNIGAFNLTNFTNGVEDQEICVVNINAGTTILKQGATIKNNTGVDVSLTANQAVRYVLRGTVWYGGA